MTATSKKIAVVGMILVFTGCATTPKEKILRDMVLAGLAGAVWGQQRQENKMAYSTLYAGVGAASAAAVGLFLYDPDKETAKYKKEAEERRKQLEEVFAPKLEQQMPGTLSAKVPEKYKSLIHPGEWRIYAVDQWNEDGENRLIHQDKVMELIPPSLKPIQNPLKTNNQ